MTLRIKEILKEKGITAIQLEAMMKAKGYKLSRISIGNILNNTHSPKVKTIEEIADTLSMDVISFFDTYTPKEMKPIFHQTENGSFEQIGLLKKD